ncbi:hypothetical protein A2U01_0096579, partial [Trifolium medium]|nr:hypothetical protein [Trifolium medium]
PMTRRHVTVSYLHHLLPHEEASSAAMDEL